jgi:hypothetical protein
VARFVVASNDGDDERHWRGEQVGNQFAAGSCQRFTGSISDDGTAIDGEWRSSDDGQQWARDFGLTYARVLRKR